jgi:hypothetical protein
MCIIPTRYEHIHCIVCAQSDAKVNIYVWNERTYQYSLIASHSIQSALLSMEYTSLNLEKDLLGIHTLINSSQ